MGDSVESLAEVKVDNIHCFTFWNTRVVILLMQPLVAPLP